MLITADAEQPLILHIGERLVGGLAHRSGLRRSAEDPGCTSSRSTPPAVPPATPGSEILCQEPDCMHCKCRPERPLPALTRPLRPE